MPRAPFALILQVSDTYLPSVRLLINGITSHRAAFLPAPWNDGGGQARHRTGIQPGQCFAVGGCVRAAGKGPASPQSPHPVELRDAAEPIQSDKAAGHLAVKVGHSSPLGF